MSANKNLNKAKSAKMDEFYTRREDIEAELLHYKAFFEGKVVTVTVMIQHGLNSGSFLYVYSVTGRLRSSWQLIMNLMRKIMLIN